MSRLQKYARPALWGFFICITIAGVLAISRLFVPMVITHNWESERTIRRAKIEQAVREAFQKRVNDLFAIGEHAASDTLITAIIKTNDIAEMNLAFRQLETYRLREDLTLDIINTQGNIIVWTGPSISSAYAQLLGRGISDRFVCVTQNGLRTYLTVGIELIRNHFYLLVSEPLEINYPISNRFIRKLSFCADLSIELNTQIVFDLPLTSIQNQGMFSIPILDKDDKLIVKFSVMEPKIINEINSSDNILTTLIIISLACGVILIAFVGVLWIETKGKLWLKIIVEILCVWTIRLVWQAIGFPSNLFGGWLFNPAVYASPFIFGFSSSIGELSLSALALQISIWLLVRGVLFNRNIEGILVRIGKRIGRIITIAIIFIIGLFIMWMFRGFNEALRSFVFDSTITYNNPSEILPDNAATLMYFIILLTGFSLLSASSVLLWFGNKLIFMQYPEKKLLTRIIFIGVLLLSIPVFTYLNATQQIQFHYVFLFLILNLILLELFNKWETNGLSISAYEWQIVLYMIIGSFLLATPLLNAKLELKERKDIEVTANELVRSSDSWQTYVLLDGLHTTALELSENGTTSKIATAKETNLAFILWTKTLLGREGFNSALIMYDDRGNEVDQFIVGLNKSEQREILTRVFEGEEDTVQVLRQTGSKTVSKLFGAWTTVRNSSGLLTGSLALILSENQKTLFNEEESEPLQPLVYRSENEFAREIAIHTYWNDSLISSNGRRLYPNRFLSSAVDSELQHASDIFLWKDIKINEYDTKTVFIKDADVKGKIVAISMEELDYRWSLFNYLKVLLIYLVVLFVLGLILLVRNQGGLWQRIGFRGKLFIGFACVALIPLIVLSYYNKQLAIEKVKEQIATSIYHQLDQLLDRINIYVSDQEDFARGVNDDFCEALASEYGIEFSIYHGVSILASSKSELYRATLLDRRLNGKAYASTVLNGMKYFLATERIGSVEYVVGYAPIYINDQVVGVLAVPTLNRQKGIEVELAQRNAYVFSIYAVVFGFVLVGGAYLAFRFARPLHELTFAARSVSQGNLNVKVDVQSKDEIGELSKSFNEMISKINISRIELAKHERESAWKEMAKQVAHEIRNPLTPIKLSIQHVIQAFRDKAPNREEILNRVTQTVINQIETLSRIASEFSNYAKMPESKFERVNVEDLLKETISLFRDIFGIDFISRFAYSPIFIIADHDQLRGVFVNIIKNAIQAMDGKGVLTIETEQDKHLCVIRISDTGPGITDEIQAKIFEPNFSTKTEGMGLGLAIARRVVEDHGGMISCISKKGNGTTFEIRLPI